MLIHTCILICASSYQFIKNYNFSRKDNVKDLIVALYWCIVYNPGVITLCYSIIYKTAIEKMCRYLPVNFYLLAPIACLISNIILSQKQIMVNSLVLCILQSDHDRLLSPQQLHQIQSFKFRTKYKASGGNKHSRCVLSSTKEGPFLGKKLCLAYFAVHRVTFLPCWFSFCGDYKLQYTVGSPRRCSFVC